VKKQKMKTRKTAVKRFKVTATGKLMRGHQHHTHLLSKKSAARKRRLVSQVEVDKVDRKRVRSMLGI